MVKPSDARTYGWKDIRRRDLRGEIERHGQCEGERIWASGQDGPLCASTGTCCERQYRRSREWWMQRRPNDGLGVGKESDDWLVVGGKLEEGEV